MLRARFLNTFAGRGLRQIALVASVAALLAVFSGIALVGANGDQLEACVNKYTGVVRMATQNRPLHCQGHEEKRAWDSEVGAITEPEIVVDSGMTGGSIIKVTAYCPTGTTVIAGGGSVWNVNYKLVSSVPDQVYNGWTVRGVRMSGTGDTNYDVYAVCAQLAN